MAEIRKLKKGTTDMGWFYEGSNKSSELSYEPLRLMESTDYIYFDQDEADEFESVVGRTVPQTIQGFIDFYENDPDFSMYFSNLISWTYGRYFPEEGDVVASYYTGGSYAAVYKWTDRSTVRSVTNNGSTVYKVVKDSDTIFHRQLCESYGALPMTSKGAVTQTSIQWRLYNKDKNLTNDVYFRSDTNAANANPAFTSTYKRNSSPIEWESFYTYTQSGLSDSTRYYGRTGIKNPTKDILPIIQDNLYFVDTLIGGIAITSIGSITESTAKVYVSNTSTTKNLDIYAYVGTSTTGSYSFKGTVAANGSSSFDVSGLSADTLYYVNVYGRYLIQHGVAQVPGEWTYWNGPETTIPLDDPIILGTACFIGYSAAFQGTNGVKATCEGYIPAQSVVYGYVPGPTSSSYVSSSFTTDAPAGPTYWVFIDHSNTNSTMYPWDLLVTKPKVPICPNSTTIKSWLMSAYPPGNYTTGYVIRVYQTSNQGACGWYWFRTE